MILNKATFAAKYGVSRAAVTLAVKSGAMVENESGHIDESHKANLAWVARRSPGAKTQTKKPERPQKKASVSPEAKKTTKDTVKPEKAQEGASFSEYEDLSEEEEYQDIGALSLAKVRADIRFKHEQADAALQKRLERLGQLVDREMVRKAFAVLGSEIKTRLVQLPNRITTRLAAMIKRGETEAEVQRYLEAEISADLIEIKKRLEQF